MFRARLARLLVVVFASLAPTSCNVGSPASSEPEIPFEPVSAQVAVRKVKNILVGLPPTTEEIAAVAADPHALSGLINNWMQLPQYEAKMRIFFSLAFQQTQLNLGAFRDIATPGLVGVTPPLLLQNVTESFARTAMALDKEGHPFKDSLATRRYMLTPALMQLLAFLDTRRVSNKGNLTDVWAAANPGRKIVVSARSGPIPIEESLNPSSSRFLHFYHPGLPAFTKIPACLIDPVVFDVTSSMQIQNILSGRFDGFKVPNPQGGEDISCPSTDTQAVMQFVPSDFTEWKMVTIRAPTSGESTMPFFDLPAMRTANELVLNIPRVGFFTTPGFMANWPTNSSNQFRGVVNQTMIVATGSQFDGNDTTESPQTPGIDTEHAGNPACFSCHRLLDPTRAIFSATYTWNFAPATDVKLVSEKGLFNFLGVTQPVGNIYEFADVLASHPAVAAGWTQKLCQYVRSAPCDPEDPEFKKLADNFDHNGSWSTLVHDLMMSPMVTNLARSTTYASSGEVVAVSRRDHLCAALDARLKLHDACGQTAALGARTGIANTPAIVAGLPSDGYGRGSTAANLPNNPTLFFAAGVENICANVAQQLIDAPIAATQPDAIHWATAQSDAALDDFTSLLVGIPKGDPDYDSARAVLAKHYADAQQTASKADSLRSTFIAACMSPTFASVGL